MSASQRLLGNWRADLDRFGQVNAEMGELSRDELEMFVGNMKVELSADTLVVDGYGGGRKERSYTVQEDGDDRAVIIATRKDGQSGTYVVEFVDDDHITMSLTEPIQDVMALVRA